MEQWYFHAIDHNKRLLAGERIEAVDFAHAAQKFDTCLLLQGHRKFDEGCKIIAERVVIEDDDE